MNDPSATSQPEARKRNRTLLIVLVVVFLGSMFIAGVLRFSGWQPEGTRNVGELLEPPGDLRDVQPRTLDGTAYPWEPEARLWRIVVAPPADCGDECIRLARDLDKVWQLFGRRADRVHVLWACPGSQPCEPPATAPPPSAMRVLHSDPALRAGLPRLQDPAGVPVYVVDPNGFVILRYPPGSDLGGLRTDLARLLKLM
ncbi:MAG: hypothetical protein M3Q42_02915 [Pseudomonadota bacterium]|nr:hypothetical protein [Pseudomonadota bacterium]